MENLNNIASPFVKEKQLDSCAYNLFTCYCLCFHVFILPTLPTILNPKVNWWQPGSLHLRQYIQGLEKTFTFLPCLLRPLWLHPLYPWLSPGLSHVDDRPTALLRKWSRDICYDSYHLRLPACLASFSLPAFPLWGLACPPHACCWPACFTSICAGLFTAPSLSACLFY